MIKKRAEESTREKKPIAKLVDAYERRVRAKHRERWSEFCNLWWLTKWFISVVYWPFNWIFHLILFGRCSFFLSGSLIHLSICLFLTDSLLLSLAGHLNHGRVCFFCAAVAFFSWFYFQYDFVFYVWFVLLPPQLLFPVSMILILFIGEKNQRWWT